MDIPTHSGSAHGGESITADQAYPHLRNDCDCCREFDADMAAHYDGLAGRALRWCQRCAGQVLAQLVLTGHTVTVGPLDLPPAFEPTCSTAPDWTVELAEQVLRQALPSGSVFLRALIDEGGTATAARMRQLTGSNALQYMTQTLTVAVRKIRGHQYTYSGSRHLAQPQRDPNNPRSPTVHSYALPTELVPIFDAALRRLSR